MTATTSKNMHPPRCKAQLRANRPAPRCGKWRGYRMASPRGSDGYSVACGAPAPSSVMTPPLTRGRAVGEFCVVRR
jgi:hypothetical protein